MRIFKKLYAVIGMLLTVSVLATGNYGLSKTDHEIYDMAMDLQENMQTKGFKGFVLEDKKVRFFDGTKDYVVFKGDINKEEAAFDTFVGTTSKIDGDYQVILPTYDNFSNMFSLLGAAQSVADGSMQFSEETYSIHAHVATLWHEAFHAWQLTNWEEEISAQAATAGITEKDDMQEIIVNNIDSKDELVVLFSGEMELLEKAYETANPGEKKALTAKALETAKKRKSLLSKRECYAEQYFEMLEGTACYIEAQAYRLLEGEEVWRQIYLGEFVYCNGTGKYYKMGMYKCLLLDQLSPEWKTDFSVTDSLDDYLYHAITE